MFLDFAFFHSNYRGLSSGRICMFSFNKEGVETFRGCQLFLFKLGFEVGLGRGLGIASRKLGAGSVKLHFLI